MKQPNSDLYLMFITCVQRISCLQLSLAFTVSKATLPSSLSSQSIIIILSISVFCVQVCVFREIKTRVVVNKHTHKNNYQQFINNRVAVVECKGFFFYSLQFMSSCHLLSNFLVVGDYSVTFRVHNILPLNCYMSSTRDVIDEDSGMLWLLFLDFLNPFTSILLCLKAFTDKRTVLKNHIEKEM